MDETPPGQAADGQPLPPVQPSAADLHPSLPRKRGSEGWRNGGGGRSARSRDRRQLASDDGGSGSRSIIMRQRDADPSTGGRGPIVPLGSPAEHDDLIWLQFEAVDV